MFDEVYEFEACEMLTLRCRVVVANSGWDAARAEAASAAWQAGGSL